MARYEITAYLMGFVGIYLWLLGDIKPEIAIGTLLIIGSANLFISK